MSKDDFVETPKTNRELVEALKRAACVKAESILGDGDSTEVMRESVEVLRREANASGSDKEKAFWCGWAAHEMHLNALSVSVPLSLEDEPFDDDVAFYSELPTPMPKL